MGETPKTALHRFLTDAPWDAVKINERRLQVMNKCSRDPNQGRVCLDFG
ncbi:MAG: hypothetical protein F6J99_26990 [Moorea sp. SIO4G3]|nr:hypothetical protein [Moorena sp. SIO4G3]